MCYELKIVLYCTLCWKYLFLDFSYLRSSIKCSPQHSKKRIYQHLTYTYINRANVKKKNENRKLFYFFYK